MAQHAKALPTNWTFELLPHPPRKTRCRGLGFWNGRPTGNAEGQRGGETRSVIWENGEAKEFSVPTLKSVHLNAGIFDGDATGTADIKGSVHAMFFKATQDGIEPVDLHPKSFDRTFAVGCDKHRQAGYGLRKGQGFATGLTWSGSAASAQELPQLGEWRDCEIRGMSDGKIFGRAAGPGVARACYWTESNDPINLHPDGFELSECLGAHAGEQVGTAWPDWEHTVPVLWRGTKESAIVLTPNGMHGGSATTCAEGVQGGWSAVDKEQKLQHAMLWAGTKESFIDLQAFVPDPFNISLIQSIRIHDGTLTAVGIVEQYVNGTYPLCRAGLWTTRIA